MTEVGHKWHSLWTVYGANNCCIAVTWLNRMHILSSKSMNQAHFERYILFTVHAMLTVQMGKS